MKIKHVLTVCMVVGISHLIHGQFLNGRMTADNPNRDPDWAWYESGNNAITLYTTGAGIRQPGLPFHSGIGHAAVYLQDRPAGEEKDMFPHQGWELVLRNFGMPNNEIRIPFILLYNKYRGILRLFYYDSETHPGSLMVGKLTNGSNNVKTANINLGMENVTLDNYQFISNDQYHQISIGQYSSRDWCFLDFDLSGYDPDVIHKTDAKFFIEMERKTVSEVSLTGNIEFTNDKGSVTSSPIEGLYTSVAKRYGSINKAQEEYEKWGEDSQGKWYEDILKGAGSVLSQDFIPYLGAVAGIVDFAIGGGKMSPKLKSASIELNGTITLSQPIPPLTIAVPGAPRSNPTRDIEENILPLYDVPLGVFNLHALPVVDLVIHESRVGTAGPGGPPIIQPNYEHHLRSIQPIYNPHIFSDIDIELSYQWIGNDNEDRSFTFSSVNSFLNHVVGHSKGKHYIGNPGKQASINNFEYDDVRKLVAMKVSLETIDNTNEKTQIVKAYHPNYSFYYPDEAPQRATYASLPFYEDFQSANNHWKFSKRSTNSIRRTGEQDPDQGYYLAMDNGDDGTTYALNDARLHVSTLQESDDIWFSYYVRNFNDEEHSQDGIFLSVDGGENFVRISSLHQDYYSATVPGPWYPYQRNLSKAARDRGLELSPTTIISFRQYDNYNLPTDGFGFDRIKVYQEGQESRNSDHLMVYDNFVNTEAGIYALGGIFGSYTGLISKTSTCNCWNAGASSKNRIGAYEDGFIKTYITEDNINSDFMFGLSHSDAGHQWNTIDYNLYVSKHRGSKIVIYERGNQRYTWSGSYAVGDEVSVERKGSTIYFKHNDQVFYTRPVDRSKSMINDVSMYTGNVSFRAYSTKYHDINADPPPIVPAPWPGPAMTSDELIAQALTAGPQYQLPDYGYDVAVDTAVFTENPFSLEQTKFFPNPIQNMFDITYSSDMSKDIQVSYTSTMDPSVHGAFVWEVKRGDNHKKTDFSQLPNGRYIIILDDGKERSSFHLIKE